MVLVQEETTTLSLLRDPDNILFLSVHRRAFPSLPEGCATDLVRELHLHYPPMLWMCGPETMRHLRIPSPLACLFQVKSNVNPEEHSDLLYPTILIWGGTTKTRQVTRLDLHFPCLTRCHHDWDGFWCCIRH